MMDIILQYSSQHNVSGDVFKSSASRSRCGMACLVVVFSLPLPPLSKCVAGLDKSLDASFFAAEATVLTPTHRVHVAGSASSIHRASIQTGASTVPQLIANLRAHALLLYIR